MAVRCLRNSLLRLRWHQNGLEVLNRPRVHQAVAVSEHYDLERFPNALLVWFGGRGQLLRNDPRPEKDLWQAALGENSWF